jgi:Sec7-like guanine-nucleotide exchange factor
VAPYSVTMSKASKLRAGGYTALAMSTQPHANLHTQRPLLRSAFDANCFVPTNYAVSNFMKIPSVALELYGDRQIEA